MKITEMFPSRFLSKDDLSTSRVFTIDEVLLEEIEGEDGKVDKPVIYFKEEDSKPMVLNKTNAETLRELLGEDTESWKGRQIEVYVDPSIRFGTKKIGGIRLREPTKKS